ncbi:PqqD family protein [soil metagenome]
MVGRLKAEFDKRKGLSPEVLRRAKPVRNPAVESEIIENGVVLRAPLDTQPRPWLGKLARKMNLPQTRTFELEAVGATVWELCDGKQTFAGITDELRKRYKMNRLEAEASLTAFLQTLSQRRLITMLLPKEGKR